MAELLGLEGKRAIVVGAGPGIGRSCAVLLARAGCDVALVDVDGEAAGKLADELRGLGRESLAITADVTDAGQAEEAVTGAVACLGGVDVLADIVGQSTWRPLLELALGDWEADLRSNLLQHFFVARPVAAQMMDQGSGGSMVFVSSVSALFAAPRHAAYGAAKAALVSLVKSMAHEWAGSGIRVNAVAPGGVLTDRFRELVEEGTANPDPATLARLADPDDIGGAVLLLSSALARRVTGQTLPVDGGSSTASPFGIV